MAKLKNLFSKITDNKNFDVVGKRTIWFVIPAIIVAIAIIFNFIPGMGMNVGIDFSGGIKIEIYDEDGMTETQYNAYKADVEKIVTDNGGVVSYSQRSGDGALVVKVSSVDPTPSDALLATLKADIQADLEAKYPTLVDAEDSYVSVSFAGASVSGELLSRALVAVGVASVLMLIYIWIRFDILSGISAVLALIHDVIITFALTVIFRVQINSSYIAAIITIIAYSINATIVLFDRARELKKHAKVGTKFDPAKIANQSVRDTFTRSFYTNISTLIPIALLAIFSVATVQEFALPIIFGLLSGFFSSVCLAPSIWTIMNNWKLKRK